MNPSRWISRHRLSLAVGLVTTLLGCLAWVGGLLTRLDNFGLDLHFRYFSSIAADPRIVMIDIDDRALESVPYSFPWPRRVFADVVSLLDELGAKTIVMDVVFDTPDEPRQVDASLGRNYDFDTDLTSIKDDLPGPPIHIFDDDELAAAMARNGHVQVPLLCEFGDHWRSEQYDADFQELVRRFEQEFFIEEFGLLSSFGTVRDRIEFEALRSKAIKAQRLAARNLARSFLSKNVSGTLAEFLRTVTPLEKQDLQGFQRQELVRAFRHSVSLENTRARLWRLPADTPKFLLHAGNPTLPMEKITGACKKIGFASWPREEGGPIVRELPLLAEFENKLILQLGFQAAVDELGTQDIHVNDNEIVLRFVDDTLSIPYSNSAASLFNWHSDLSGRWQDSFLHIPVTRFVEVASNMDAIHENILRKRYYLGQLVTLRHESLPVELSEYRGWVNKRQSLEYDLRTARNGEEQVAIRTRLDQIVPSIDSFERESLVWLTRTMDLWRDQEPTSDEERLQKKTATQLYAQLVEDPIDTVITRLNSELSARVKNLKSELQLLVKDKICFVGYTASAQADLVATPVHPAMPGVMVHANIANTILQNRPAWRASTSINLTCLVVLGMLVTFLSSTRGGVFAVGALVFLLMLTLFAGAYVFKHWVYHLPTIATCVTAMFVWASVTLCRQLIEERSRKRFQAALAQYTSPAIAAQIADRASAIDLAPRSAVVSCFFADLQGFTTLSEKLGPERTQRVLNPYLKAVSDVLIRHNAMVNKFMGDGIFAFFNAPIWPCKDPASAACRSALAAQQALNELNRSTIAKEAGVPLKMRIGLSTGEVFVGDYGSDTKLDYTCIGDNVNIAGRLQAANKEFGTGILVDAQTKNAAGDQFSFRPIGDQKLTGKTQTVAVFELTGFAKPGTTIAADA